MNVSKHVAVLAFPFASHPGALFALVRRLSAAAPEAKFSFFNTAQSNSKIFSKDDPTLQNIKPYSVQDGLPENYVFSGNPAEPLELFLKGTPGNFRRPLKEAADETGKQFTCLIADAFFWFAGQMAQEMGVPWLALWSAAPHAVVLHVETDLIRSKMGFHGSEDRTIDFLPGFSAIRGTDIPDGIIAGDLTSTFATMLHKTAAVLPRAAAVATNSFEEVDPILAEVLKSKFHKFLNIGPFALTPAQEPNISDPELCIDWLNKQKPGSVAYISFGSMITPPPDELAALAQALEESRYPFIWSFRGNPAERLPKGFLDRTKENGKVVSWAPQMAVLQHDATGVFVTHSGWNSITESIIGCVPLLCRAFFGDQPLNTRIVEKGMEIGMGIEGGKITKDGIVKALRVILSGEEGMKMRSKLQSLKKLASNAVKPNGSSTQNFRTLVEIVRN